MVNTLDVGVVELLVDVVNVDGTEAPDETLDGGAELGVLGSEEVELDTPGGSEEVGEFELDGDGGSKLNEELEELEGSAELDVTEILAAAEEDVVEANVEEAAA
jgi:hypothetical protein